MSSIDRDRKTADLVIEGLEAAMHDVGIEAQDLDYDGYGQQRLNKLVYSGLYWKYGDEVSLQRSWHRYGIELGNAVKDHTLVRPSPAESYTSASGARRHKLRQIEEYYYFFKDGFELDGMGLKETINANFHDLLEAFYSRYADPSYRQLYLANVELQRQLASDAESVHPDQFDQNDCFELGDIITTLHGELFSCDVFREAPSGYRVFTEEEGYQQFQDFTAIVEDAFDQMEEFTDLYEDVYMMLSEKSSDEITGDPETILDGFDVFYHEFAWKAVTELISIKTATGRDHRELWQGAIEELSWIQSTYDEKLSKHRGLADQAGLLPDVGDYSFDEEDTELLEESKEVTSTYSD